LVWIGLSMTFSAVIYFSFGYANGVNVGLEKFSQFQSAYWIEKSLSVDNLFVFILVFGFFQVPKENQHKVLFLGNHWCVTFARFLHFCRHWLDKIDLFT